MDKFIVPRSDESATPYHFVEFVKKELLKRGYVHLKETEIWPTPLPKKGFVIRDGISIVAFTISGYDSIALATCENGMFALKLKPEYEYCENGYYWLRAAYFGSLDLESVQDRDLRVAGAVFVNHNGKMERRLVDSVRGIATMATKKIPQKTMDKDLCYHLLIGKSPLKPYIAKLAQCDESEIVDWDLYFVPAGKTVLANGFFRDAFAHYLGLEIGLFIGFIDKEDGGSNVKMAAFHGVGDKYTLHRASCASDLVPSVLREIFKDHDYETAKARSLHLFLSPLNNSVGDEQHVVSMKKGVVLRTSVRSNIATEPLGQHLLQTFSYATTQVSCDKNSAISASTNGSCVEQLTGIRTAEIGICCSKRTGARTHVAIDDIGSLAKYIKDFYNNYAPVNASF